MSAPAESAAPAAPAAAAAPTTSVVVRNIAPTSDEKTVSEFFSFCGRINRLTLRRNAGPEGTHEAYVWFETEAAAKTALLLTNALIGDRAISVAVHIEALAPAPLVDLQATSTTTVSGDQITNKTFAVPDHERSATSVVASMLAAGHKVTHETMERARAFDESIGLTQRVSAALDEAKRQANAIDERLQISTNVTATAAAINTAVSSTAAAIDDRLHITATAAPIIASAAETAKGAGDQIMAAATTGTVFLRQTTTELAQVAAATATEVGLTPYLTGATSTLTSWTNDLAGSLGFAPPLAAVGAHADATPIAGIAPTTTPATADTPAPLVSSSSSSSSSSSAAAGATAGAAAVPPPAYTPPGAH